MANEGSSPDSAMATAVVRGMAFGVPAILVGMTFGIWLITDLDLMESLVTALLPGTLLGAFGGGFAGVAMTMRE